MGKLSSGEISSSKKTGSTGLVGQGPSLAGVSEQRARSCMTGVERRGAEVLGPKSQSPQPLIYLRQSGRGDTQSYFLTGASSSHVKNRWKESEGRRGNGWHLRV